MLTLEEIAAMRARCTMPAYTDVPKLLDEVERLQTENNTMRESISVCGHHCRIPEDLTDPAIDEKHFCNVKLQAEIKRLQAEVEALALERKPHTQLCAGLIRLRNELQAMKPGEAARDTDEHGTEAEAKQ